LICFNKLLTVYESILHLRSSLKVVAVW
jgi:hypothetical protein